MVARVLALLALLASPVAAQVYPPEQPPLIDPIRVFEAMTGVAFDEPLDTSEIIDVLVVWSACGGFTTELAQSAVDNANADYARSLIRGRLRLVGAQQVSYHEGMGQGLSWMNNAGRPEIDAIRNAVGADVVAMVTCESACGIGYLNASAMFAFSTSHRDCTIGNRTFQHEIGHNQGAHHDPGQGGAPNCGADGVANYNCGHAFAEGRTNMAYNGGPRLGYFSNPAVSHNGSPTGIVGQRNNALILNANFARVAGFRPSIATTPAPRPSGAQPVPKV